MFTISKRQLFDEKGKPVPAYGVYRDDNNRFLDSVGSGWTPIQTKSITDAIGKELQLFKSTITEIQGGRQVTVVYPLEHPIVIKGTNDLLQSSLGFRINHGIGAVYSYINTVRLVCTNGMKVQESERLVSLRHDQNADVKLLGAAGMVSDNLRTLQTFGKKLNRLAEIKLKLEDVGEITKAFFNKSETDNIFTNARSQNQARDILVAFEHNDGDKVKKVRGTAWNLLNAFTYYADHRWTFRTSDVENVTQSKERTSVFGAGNEFKQRAFADITAYCKVS